MRIYPKNIYMVKFFEYNGRYRTAKFYENEFYDDYNEAVEVANKFNKEHGPETASDWNPNWYALAGVSNVLV